jgi:hypothetical protein
VVAVVAVEQVAQQLVLETLRTHKLTSSHSHHQDQEVAVDLQVALLEVVVETPRAVLVLVREVKDLVTQEALANPSQAAVVAWVVLVVMVVTTITNGIAVETAAVMVLAVLVESLYMRGHNGT